MPFHARAQFFRWTILAARVFLGVVFLYDAYTKLRLPWQIFAMSINSYQLLPEWAVILTARTLPAFELVLGLLLIAGYKLRYVAAVSTALLGFFLGIMIRSYVVGLGIDCGCFGVGEALSVNTLVRDSLLALLSLGLTVAAFRQQRNSKLEIRNSAPA